MSYRDVRNCTEMLRALGYPKLVSMESFRKPNFPLITSLLLWLTKRFDPDVDIPGDMQTEEERVALIRNVAQFMGLKANIKLNTKRLYQADGYAVREILKVTSLLYEALVTNAEDDTPANQEEDVELTIRDFDFADKLHDLKQSRQLATEITMTGASLFDLLGHEINLRGLRETSVSRQFEVHDVDGGIRRAIDIIGNEVDDTKAQIDNVSASEASLDGKLERRRMEIERYEKRLQTLKKVRPAFLEEFINLEVELNSLFEKYSTRVRCLAQLEKLASDAERAHIQRAQLASSQRAMTTTIPLEDTNEDDLILDEPVTAPNPKINQNPHPVIDKKLPPSRQERPRARTGGRTRQDIIPPTNNLSKVYGGMDPGMSNSNSSFDISSDDTDDDELFLDKHEPELEDVQSDEDSLGLEFSAMEINKRAPSGRMTSSKITMPDNSDDDF
ncbi:clusterin-associated protein 1 isoform X1 [Atheta coriaria]|uniref:clusterin-associated protein 1 isoform X1 n=1 Tax=Dalotia coriaria TaxID=877792 RepID=UPI0031F44A7C